MKKRILILTIVCLGAFMLYLVSQHTIFQTTFSRLTAKASSQPYPSEIEGASKVKVQKQDEVSNSTDSKTTEADSTSASNSNSSAVEAGSSSQQTLSPSAPTGSASNPEQSGSSTQAKQEKTQLTGPASDVVWSVPTKERVVFITVDDGWYPSDSVLTIMRAQHVPITTFLIENAAKEHPDFWRDFEEAGGVIENHTVSHPDLTKVAPDNAVNQIETAEKYFVSFSTPTLFRPPYGAYNQTVCQAAYQAGIKHLIMWNATMTDGGLQTYNGKPLEPGSIILLHWVPNLTTQLENLLGILNREHLGVASLPDALEHPDKFPIAWPLAQAGE